MGKKKIIQLIMGPAIFIVVLAGLSNVFDARAAQALAMLAWMVFWWITCPVHMTVTAFLPIIVNAFFNIVPMASIIPQYFSNSAVLILGAGLITAPWEDIGLDRRIALKALSIIGPSIKAQITAWMLLSMFLSVVLPNVAVCALLSPIAATMLRTVCNGKDIRQYPATAPILLCIGWGSGLGGAMSPLGGAMNITAISLLEKTFNNEFVFIDWVLRMAPFNAITAIVMIIMMKVMFKSVPELEGSKEYFVEQYKNLGPTKPEEKFCLTLFIVGVFGAFARPLYASILPALEPAHLLLIVGCVSFFIWLPKKNAPLLSWEKAESDSLWGMIMLFGGGLALGQVINESGASKAITSVLGSMNLKGGLPLILVVLVVAVFLSETTCSTVSSACVVPIVLALCIENGLNPIPYWFVTCMAFNAEFLLPISVRAIPVGYGLDPKIMLQKGLPYVFVRMVLVVIVGYACLKWWPYFGTSPFLFN